MKMIEYATSEACREVTLKKLLIKNKGDKTKCLVGSPSTFVCVID